MFQKCEELFKKYTYMILHTHITRSLKQSKGRKKDKMEKERERESMRDKKCKRARKEFIFTSVKVLCYYKPVSYKLSQFFQKCVIFCEILSLCSSEYISKVCFIRGRFTAEVSSPCSTGVKVAVPLYLSIMRGTDVGPPLRNRPRPRYHRHSCWNQQRPV